MFLVADTPRWLFRLAIALLLAGCGQSEPQAAAPTTAPAPTVRAPAATAVPPTTAPPTAAPPTTAPAPAATTAPAPPPAPSVVEILTLDNRFEPPYVEVPRGTTVRWINRGQNDHDVTSEDLKTFTSPVVKPGQTFEATLTQPGAIPYVCSLHDGMTATLVVR